MKRFFYIILLSYLFGIMEVSAQKLILTPNGMCSSENLSIPYVEYMYKDGISQKDLKNYCIQKLGQPDFFSYRVDYTDERNIKLSGFVKKSLKGIQFNLLLEFEQQSVRVSSQLLEKSGQNLDCKRYFTKKGKVKDWNFKTQVERRVDDIIRSMMDMKIVVRQ